MVKLIRKYLSLCILVLLVGLLLFEPYKIYAYKELVFDEVGLFTEEEWVSLESEVNRLASDYNMDIVITTTNDTKGKSSREYADDYFDYGGFGQGQDRDGILFLIDMDNREAYISSSGLGIRYLTDQRIEGVLDEVFDSGLGDGDYYGASQGFLRKTRQYLEAGIPSNQYSADEKEPNRVTLFDMLIGLVGGTATGGIFYGSTKSAYKLKNPGNPFSYRNNSIVNIGPGEDRLIDSAVTHRIIPRPPKGGGSSGGGRSTTHRSSSGRTHGGGGRKF